MKNLKGFALAAVVFVAAFVITTEAQNFVQRFDSYAQGAPGFTLQSPGPNYGQIVNISSWTWGIGSGTSQSTNGNTAITWSKGGFATFLQTNKAGFDSISIDLAGAPAICIDCTQPYSLCLATGTQVSQWLNLINLGQVNTTKHGCGSGN